jgi:hypothetical protein
MTTKTMNHTEYPKSLKKKTEAELRYIIAECKEVIRLQKDFNPNIGYYEDEVCYCVDELHRRAKGIK